jgi:hypothetical protein
MDRKSFITLAPDRTKDNEPMLLCGKLARFINENNFYLITRRRQSESQRRVVVLQHRDVVVQVGKLTAGVAKKRAGK